MSNTASRHSRTTTSSGSRLTNHSLNADYYADLELPTNASIDDVRKAYRKLALQYHPDRNAGREEECVPKFQAIQQANEVLGDPGLKQKYDVDRRKAGLYPTTQPTGFTPRQPTPGNPYTATSAYPPPPRRTQPGTWQRPQPAAGAGATPAGATGADRFSNFPRPSHPTAKKDHAQDRANMFQAWQNMNTPQNRQSRFSAQQAPPQPPPPPPPQPQAQPQTARPRPPPPQPPPRPTNTMPTEEQIRAGTKYRQPPPTAPGVDGLNERQKAWKQFEQNGPPKPGINRSNTSRTPRKQGFDPNTPGSDERAAPSIGRGYVHRNKSADFGRPRPFPPPPPGAPPTGQTPTSPLSPNVSPTSARPGTDPMRPDRTQVPYAEGNRNRTPYTSFIGEKTDFGDNLRRSHSTHNTTKLDPEDAANKSRARSSSPTRRESTATNQSSGKPFVVYSSSSAASSASDMAQTPEAYDSTTEKQRPGTAPDPSSNRPKKTPTAPSSRVNGHGNRSGPSSPMPPTTASSDANGNGMPAEGMQQGAKPNMYANPSPFDQQTWITATFGSLSTSRAKQSRFKFPCWAIPGSVNPSLKPKKPTQVESVPYTTAADRLYICATEQERQAYIRFQALLRETFDHVPSNLDMSLFNTLISRFRRGMSSGKPELDQLVLRLLTEFPSVGAKNASDNHADQGRSASSFKLSNNPNLFAPSTHKSRSEEHINTKFSPDGWSGTFTGEPDYFPSNGTTKSRSPSRRPVSSRAASSQRRAATMDMPTSSGGPREEPTQRAWGSDGQPKDVPSFNYTAPNAGFSTADWQKQFQDPSWTMPPPPPPPNPPSPSKLAASAPGSRRPSRTLRPKKGQTFQSHVDGVTVELEDDDGKHDSGVPNVEDFDAMDIDDTPPAQRKTDQTSPAGDTENEARLYSVPPSAWRQQQEQVHAQQSARHRKTSSASRRAQRASASSATGAKLNTNLDDLRNVEPISRTAGPTVGGGFNNMSSMSDDLPFQSASAKSIPPETLQALDIPQVPTKPELPRRWSKLTWHMYAEHFAHYLKLQHEFNKKMLSYFAVRLQSDEQLMAAGSKAWLEASGVTQDGIGFEAYAKDVRRDDEMRTTWDIGCERHREAVKEFGESRERVRGLAQAGTLPE